MRRATPAMLAGVLLLAGAMPSAKAVAAPRTDTTPPATATRETTAPDAALAKASGAPDGDAPGWTITTRAPTGWTADCCTYAHAIGVDMALYRGEWTGKPDRVMVLNVWPRKLPTLAAETQADRAQYLKRDPHASVVVFDVPTTKLSCRGWRYRGSDRVDDLVVFCDPGASSGIRYSWSMALPDDDAQRDRLTALFRQVVADTRYAPVARMAIAH